MLVVCGQLFSDCWPIIALLLGIGIAIAIYEVVTKSSVDDQE